jgi:hypothetical protein
MLRRICTESRQTRRLYPPQTTRGGDVNIPVAAWICRVRGEVALPSLCMSSVDFVSVAAHSYEPAGYPSFATLRMEISPSLWKTKMDFVTANPPQLRIGWISILHVVNGRKSWKSHHRCVKTKIDFVTAGVCSYVSHLSHVQAWSSVVTSPAVRNVSLT